jgi:uncharacterized protein YeaO (DUF488 family)
MEGKTTVSMMQIKRIYDPASDEDGYRILIDRLWPRGIKKDQADIDLWLKEAAPTTGLRKWFHENPPERWQEFRKAYHTELEKNEALADFEKLAEEYPVITLVYGAKDGQHNHALVLQYFLNETLMKSKQHTGRR